jgi:microcystin-dependent protein
MAVTWGSYSGYIRIGIEPSVSGTTATIKVYANVSGYYNTNYASLSVTRSGSSTTLTHSPVSVHLSAGGTALIYTTSASYVGTQTWKATLSVSSLGNYPSVSKAVTVASASQPSISPSTITLGNSATINTNRASSSYTHTLTAKFGNYSTTIGTGVTTSKSFTPDPASHAKQIPNATSSWGTITCTTYSGSTTVGSKTTKYTVSIPSSYVPTIGTTSVTEAGDVTSTAKAKGYFTNISNLTLGIGTSSGYYGSTISKSQITFEDTTYTQNSSAAYTKTGVVPLSSGSQTITYKVTDSRSRTDSETKTINVYDYTTPTINTFTVERCNSSGTADPVGTYCKVTYNISASNVSSAGLSNKITFAINYKKTTDSAYSVAKTSSTSSGTSATGTFIFGGGNLDIANTYDVQITATDIVYTKTVTVETSLSTGQVALSLAKTGVGVGKVWQRGSLDVGGDAYISGSTDFLPAGVIVPYAGSTAPDGWLICDGSTVDSATYPELYAIIGTTYGGSTSAFRLPDLRGRVPVGYSTSHSYATTLGTKGGESTHTLTISEMPAHTHGYSRSNVQNYVRVEASSTYGRSANVAATTGSTGGGEAHNNLQPYIVLNYIIRSR